MYLYAPFWQRLALRMAELIYWPPGLLALCYCGCVTQLTIVLVGVYVEGREGRSTCTIQVQLDLISFLYI